MAKVWYNSSIINLRRQEAYEIVEGRLGPRLNLNEEWSDTLLDHVDVRQIREIGVRYWPASNVDFLTRFPRLLGLQLGIKDADPTPITHLRELKWISLYNFSKIKIDFSNFPSLEDCSIHWASTVSSILQVDSLVRLAVEKLPKQRINELAGLPNLENLAVLHNNANSLDVLRSLSKLSSLRVNRFHHLENCKFLEALHNLKHLWVQDSTGFSSLSSVAALTHLEEVVLDTVGPIESLNPLASIRSLRTVVIMGDKNTCLLDTNVDNMLRLPNLVKLSVVGPDDIDWVRDKARDRV